MWGLRNLQARPRTPDPGPGRTSGVIEKVCLSSILVLYADGQLQPQLLFQNQCHILFHMGILIKDSGEGHRLFLSLLV